MLASSLSIDSVSVVRGTSGTTDAVFTVTLSPANIEQTVTVDFATMNGTAVANQDYLPVNGTLTFLPDDTTMTIHVPVIGSTRVQPDRTFFVDLSNPANATIATAQGVGTIITPNRAGTLQFSSPTFAVNKDGGAAIITVTRAGGTAGDVSVQYATAGGTATPGLDYLPVSGVLTFGPNDTVETFTVPIVSNLILEGNRTVDLLLSNPTGGATLGSPAIAVLTIIDTNSLVVTNTRDSGPGSLRQAMLIANANPGPNTIVFDIPGPGPFTIAPASPLPTIVDPVVIDAATQPGYAGRPIVRLDGAGAGNLVSGLTIEAGNSTVRGLAISRFQACGILFLGGGGNHVEGDWLGTDLTGMAPSGNAFDGVTIIDSANNTVGGTSPGAGNLISGNGLDGVRIAGSSSTGNLIEGNLIGTDLTGTRPLPNLFDGVFLDGAPNNVIGGDDALARNVISANRAAGVQILGGSSSGNLVLGNLIGTDITGSRPLGNAFDGVFLDGAPRNTVGGPDPASRNIIAANQLIGVRIAGATASGNVIQGNRIGTDVTGTRPLGNATDGVTILGSPGNKVGGTSPGTGNLVSGNASVGIQVFGVGASGNQVLGNFVGTDAAGTGALGNGRDGVFINDAPRNVIGGTTPGAGNLISANGRTGLQLFNQNATGNVVQGNLIGTDANLRPRLGNLYGLFINSAPGNIIGGPGAARNVITNNRSANLVPGNGVGGPVVADVVAVAGGPDGGSIVLNFSNTLDPARALSLSNYGLRVWAPGRRSLGPKVDLGSVQYDATARDVTLIPGAPLSAGTRYQLTVSGTPPRGLTDTSGHYIDGDRNGRSGGDFVATLSPGSTPSPSPPFGIRRRR